MGWSLNFKNIQISMQIFSFKEVDIYISGSTLTIDKAPYVDGSHPVLFDTIEIMTRYPSIKHKSNALVAIYSLAVTIWSIVIVTI